MKREIPIQILASAVKAVTGQRLFNITAEVTGDSALVSIIGDIGSWQANAERFKETIDSLISKGVTSIEGYVNTFGGSTFDAFEINNILDRFPGTSEVCRTGAVCASAGTILTSRFNKVISASNTQWMFHRPLLSIDGNEDEVESGLALLRNVQNAMIALYVKKTGKSEQYIKDVIKNDNWMTPEVAKSHGFVDEIGEAVIIDASDIMNIKACYKDIPPSIAAAFENPNPKNFNPNNNTDMELKILAATVGLDPNTATESEVNAKINQLKTNAALYEQLTKSQAEEKKVSNTTRTNAAIDAAVTAKKLKDTPDNRKLYASVGETSGAEALENIFAGMPAPKKPTASIPAGSQENHSDEDPDRANWTYDDYRDKDPEGLKAMAKSDEAKFLKLHAAYKKSIK
jgi:ATP-dependent protease ClpP protease subunit